MEADEKEERIIQTLSNCSDFGDAKIYYNNLLKFKKFFDNDKEKTFVVDILESIGNRDRFLILDALKNKDRCVCELEAILDKTQPAVSHHLKILEDSGLIKGWKKGRFTHYSLIKQTFSKFESLMNDWLSNIRNWFG